MSQGSSCLSNAKHRIGQNIKSLWHVWCPSVRPAAVYEIVTSFMDRSSPNLEHSFSVPRTRKGLWSSSTGSSIRACATINRLPLTNVVFGYIWGLISRKRFKIAGRCQWDTNRKSHTANRWSRDRWRHAIPKAKVMTPIRLCLNISKSEIESWFQRNTYRK